jgi:putative transposase
VQGWPPRRILRTIPRSRTWLYKWQQRFRRQGWPGLRNQSRQPHHSPHAYSAATRAAVIRARQILEQRTVGLIGPTAIQAELRSWPHIEQVPARTTIRRILTAVGIGIAPPPAPAPYYPSPTPSPDYPIHAMDWTERYLPGGAKVYAFHTVDLQTHALTQTLSPDKALAAVRTHLLTVWTHLGRPAGLQMDNDGVFCGGYKVRRVVGQVVRLCLYMGIEPIFIPVGEPKRNGVVERVNGLWSAGFWERRHFETFADVVTASPEFVHWYMHEYQPPALHGLTPAAVQRPLPSARLSITQVRALPERLPITAGRVHFLRQVDAAGEISLLNERWRVGKRWAQRYVWATISTHRHELRVYYRANEHTPVRLLGQWAYPLDEPVVPLQRQFCWCPRRRKLTTML